MKDETNELKSDAYREIIEEQSLELTLLRSTISELKRERTKTGRDHAKFVKGLLDTSEYDKQCLRSYSQHWENIYKVVRALLATEEYDGQGDSIEQKMYRRIARLLLIEHNHNLIEQAVEEWQ